MNDYLTIVSRSIPLDWITGIVLFICCGLAWAAYKYEKWREIAPTLMVSIGITGTFFGTFIALAAFETGAGASEIIDSIPAVLGGMKSAFITSLFGLIFAFFTRIYIKCRLPTEGEKPTQVEKDFSDLLRDIKDSIRDDGGKNLSDQIGALQAQYRDSTSELKKAIIGDGDSSIATQITKLRNENSDGFRELKNQFSELSKTIGDSLGEKMQELIEEIRVSIREGIVVQLEKTNKLLREQLKEMLDRIEEALIKQFGETFKQFNEATQAIKKWQEDHRQHVEELTEAFKLTADGIEKIRKDCESIPITMQTLQDLLGELDERLKAFAEMKATAEQSFPVIKNHLDKIGADLQKSAEGFTGLEQTIATAYTKASELAQQHIEESQRHIENVGTQINQTAEQVATVSNNMMAESQKTSNEHQIAMQVIVAEMKDAAQQSVAVMQRSLDDMSMQFNVQTTTTMEQIKTTAENMLDESRNASVKHQEDIRNIIVAVTRESEKCVQETQEKLKQMAEDHARNINDEMTGITERWGENMIGIAEQVAEEIRTGKRNRDSR